MLRVAIGPVVSLPSWDWIGFDLARELAKYFEVSPFERQVPACDVLVAVKFIAPGMFGTHRVIYLPVDAFGSPRAIAKAASVLQRCSAAGCHTESLCEHVLAHTPRTFFVEHHIKYSLASPPPYRERGYVLWIGAFEHLPYLLKWHQMHPLPAPWVLLTNVDEPRSRKAGIALAQALDVPLDLTEKHLNGHRLIAWSPRAQRDLMTQAKAAIDIKGGPWLDQERWHQPFKPPTKAQQFVLSGIPFAVNRDSHSFDYFRQRGLTLATPEHVDRWFSLDYWKQIKEYAEAHRAEFTLERIGAQFRDLILEVAGN